MSGTTASTEDEKAIRLVVKTWHEATRAGDVDTVLTLMTDDVVFLVAGKPPMRGRDAFAQQLRELLASHTVESTGEIQEVEVSGDLAYCWTYLHVRIISRADGKALDRSGSALSILRRRADGAWAIRRDANLLPTPTEHT
jgi:uncharacterized protein (TIGR02246 family)